MVIHGKELSIPVIQGGMGVGVSMGNLAGHVARCGALGVISSVNIGFREPDFLKHPVKANLRALQKEIEKAKQIAGGSGLVGVNIMTAVTHYEETCRCAAEAGADVIISGAGLPVSLPACIRDTDTLCAPIVSGGRAARLLKRQYERHYQRKPDFFIIEGHEAGGHLGFSRQELVEGTARSNRDILKEVLAETEGEDIPVFVAGGVFTGRDMAEYCKAGAAGVQIGTRFIATEECDAHPAFKEMILKAEKEDIVIIESPVGMPARAINSPLLQRLKAGAHFPALHCNNCLTACKKGDLTPYCISRALIEAVKGNVEDGLFFTGSNACRIHQIQSVSELISEIMKEYREAMA